MVGTQDRKRGQTSSFRGQKREDIGLDTTMIMDVLGRGLYVRNRHMNTVFKSSDTTLERRHDRFTASMAMRPRYAKNEMILKRSSIFSSSVYQPIGNSNRLCNLAQISA
jgi:hypothetical protein